MSIPRRSRHLVIAVAVALVPGLAEAHPDTGHVAGFVAGFLHPLSGIDHLFTMTAVGLIAASVGGRARWIVPLAFVACMLVGWYAGAADIRVPYVEAGIALSLVALGGMLALGRRWPLAWAAAAAAFFGLFHGHAHGTEMPATLAGLTYAAGFTLASGALIGCGVGLGMLLAAGGTRTARLGRLGGAVVAATGLGLLFTRG
jgi:urease accessory protein